MSVFHSDLPPTYSTINLSPEDVTINMPVLHSDLPPTYSTINLSPAEVANNISVQQRVLPLTDDTLDVSPEEVAIDVDFNHGSRVSMGISCQLVFTQKVISIILMQLLAVIIVYAILAHYRIIITLDLICLALAVTFVPFNAMACYKSLRRPSSVNLIFLGIFTIAESFLLGAVAATGAPAKVMMAAGITTAMSLVLTLLAFQTKCDFTIMGRFLFCPKIVLLILGTASFFIFVGSDNYVLLVGCIGAPIFCMYHICDTQLMMGGKHKYSISPEEYIFAALNLYVDMVNIFLYILMIIDATWR